MTTKAKSTKPRKPAVKASAPINQGKLQDVYTLMWDGMNLLKMIELTAEELAHGSAPDEDLLFAICTASRSAVKSIKEAYDLVDEIDLGHMTACLQATRESA